MRGATGATHIVQLKSTIYSSLTTVILFLGLQYHIIHIEEMVM